MLDKLLYLIARALVAGMQALPLRQVARLGRACGLLAYVVDRRHRRVATRNLTHCFGQEKSAAQIQALVRENFRRLGENYACAIKTAVMTTEQLRPHVEVFAPRLIAAARGPAKPRSVVAAIGHFGNFELYARFGAFAPPYQCGTTYRGLRQPSLNRLLQSLRERSGCRYFERRSEAASLKKFMNQRGVMLGLLADQSAANGLWLPFLGRDCSTSAAPALFALRYDCSLYVAICYRVSLAQWHIDVDHEIETHRDGAPRPAHDIMLDVNRAFETAVRRDPANWFWVHNRWKPKDRRTKYKPSQPAPAAADERRLDASVVEELGE